MKLLHQHRNWKVEHFHSNISSLSYTNVIEFIKSAFNELWRVHVNFATEKNWLCFGFFSLFLFILCNNQVINTEQDICCCWRNVALVSARNTWSSKRIFINNQLKVDQMVWALLMLPLLLLHRKMNYMVVSRCHHLCGESDFKVKRMKWHQTEAEKTTRIIITVVERASVSRQQLNICSWFEYKREEKNMRDAKKKIRSRQQQK